MSPMMMIGAGAVLLVLGVGLGLWIGTIGRGKEVARTAEIRAELDDYRRQVSEHFNTTARHFESIGAEYRRLYEHMATGAGVLCDERPSVFSDPIEQIEVNDTDEDSVAEPPRDYETAVEAEEERVAAVDTPAEAADPEPTDTELAETESAEELLAEREISADADEGEKTLH